jgi:hypothetical protein
MGKARTLQSNFSTGELSKRLDFRSDLQRFFSGLALNENWFLYIEGGMAKRPGTLINGQPQGNTKSMLVAFSKSAFDVLMLEFTHLAMRVWLPSGQLVTVAGNPYVLTTPWAAADLPYLNFSGASDVVWITDRRSSSVLRALNRFANDNWSVVDIDVRNGPFLPLSDPGVTLTASGVTGAVTVTASANVFSAAKVGAIYRLRENVGNPPLNRWEAAKTVVIGDKRQNGGRVYKATNAGTTGTTAPIHWEGEVSDGAVTWEFVHDGAGVFKITGYTDPVTVSATVLVELPSASATTFWEEGAFSPLNGYPAALCIHQERLFAGQTIAEPDTLFASSTGGYGADFVDFKPGLGTGLVVDSDAIKRTLTGGQVRPILHLISAGSLIALTPKTIEVVAGPSDREPITPAGASAVSRPGLGASPFVTPVRGSEEVLYVGFSQGRLLALPWSEQGSDGRARNLSAFAEHLGKLGNFIAIALCEDPEPTVWVLNDKGQLFGVAYSPAQEVVGWWRAPIGGPSAFVESIATLQRSDGKDELWLSVRRTFGALDVRTVERMGGFLRPGDPRDLTCRLDGAYYWDTWNLDITKYVSVGASSLSYLRGQSTPITFSTSLFDAGDIGKEIWLRIDSVDKDDRAFTLGPVRLKITAIASTTAGTVEAVTDIPADFVGKPMSNWAKPFTTLAGLTAWANQKVRVFADFRDFGEFTVSGSGQITLETPSARGFAGFSYTARARLLALDIASEIGTSFGGKVRADRLSVFVQDAVSLQAGPRDGPKDLMIFRQPQDVMSIPPAPSDRIKTVPYPGKFDDVIDVEFISDDPFPIELAGLSLRVVAND